MLFIMVLFRILNKFIHLLYFRVGGSEAPQYSPPAKTESDGVETATSQLRIRRRIADIHIG